MSNADDVTFSLKIVTNKQETKILFAEADSDFADVLLGFLTLPLAKIVQVLEKHYGVEAPVIGSLTALYNGLVNLDIANFWSEGGKRMLLNPTSSFGDVCRQLKLDTSDDQGTKFFCCEDIDCGHSKKSNMSLYHGIAKCDCGKRLIRRVPMKNVSERGDGEDNGVFIERGTTFIISDDLLIMPNAPGSVIQILGNLGVTDADWGEIKNVTFGFNEIMDLLKGLFLSRTPLTDIILNKGRINLATPSEPEILLPKVEKKRTSNSDKMTLKIFVQKSTNKLLFAQAEEDFVDVLFSLLTIPLGGVGNLLEGRTCLKNIDNLYKSVTDLIDKKYFESTDAIDNLIDPMVPQGYISEYQVLPLGEENAIRKIYYYRGYGVDDDFVSFSHNMGGTCVKVTSFKYQKGHESYIKGPKMYIVNDDLSVTPSCMKSHLSTLNGLKIPLSDVTELVLHVGLEEVLSILKASLVSTSALSNGLNPFLLLKKKPKQEC